MLGLVFLFGEDLLFYFSCFLFFYSVILDSSEIPYCLSPLANL